MFQLKPIYKLQQTQRGGTFVGTGCKLPSTIWDKSICTALSHPQRRCSLFWRSGHISLAQCQETCIASAYAVPGQLENKQKPLHKATIPLNPSITHPVSQPFHLQREEAGQQNSSLLLKMPLFLIPCSSSIFFFFPDKHKTDWTGNTRLFTADLLKMSLGLHTRRCHVYFRLPWVRGFQIPSKQLRSHVSVIGLLGSHLSSDCHLRKF